MSDVLEMVPAEAVSPVNFGIEAMIARAIDRNLSPETMEKFLAMRRELKAEAAKEAFVTALAAFQSDCPIIAKTKVVMNKDGRTARYRYAPLESIVNQVSSLLQKHGFSYSLDADVEPDWVTATCLVQHRAGHAEKSKFKVPIDPDAYMNEAQKFASALTFTKRYSFCGAFGILTGDEDDDSLASKDAPKAPPAPPQPSRPAPKPPTPQMPPRSAAKPVPASRAERIEGLKSWLGPKANAAVAFLRNFTVDGSDANCALMPNEELDGLNDSALDQIKADPKGFLARLDEFIAHNGTPLAPADGGQTPSEPAHPGSASGSAPQPPQPVANPEWFWDVIVTVPHKGEKRADYIKNPDTIRSLYDDMKGGDYDAQKRLFGFVSHYNPEPWKGNDGKMRQPSEADLQFRRALDAFADYEEANKDVPQ